MLVPQTKVGVVSSAPSSPPSSEEGGGSSVCEGVVGGRLDLAAEGRDAGGVEFGTPRREGGGGVANCDGVEDLARRRREAGEE